MRNKGFTLVELLVVVAIIGLLTTLAVAAFNYAQKKAKIEKANHDIASIYSAITMLANDTVEWPGHQEIMKVNLAGANNEFCTDGCAFRLSDPEAGLTADDSYGGWTGPYMNQIPIDAWGNEYFFDTDYQVNIDNEPCNGGGVCIDVVVVGSYGPDGVGNNLYNSDDIIKIISK